MRVLSYEGYDINDYSFYTKQKDNMKNSGITLAALSSEYESGSDRMFIEIMKSYYVFIDVILELY